MKVVQLLTSKPTDKPSSERASHLAPCHHVVDTLSHQAKGIPVDLSVEDAREARSVIKAFHTVLNSPSLVPEQCYRRNKVSYELICYVNNLMGLFLGKNYHVIPTFIARADRHMTECPPTPGSQAYYEVVEKYLAQMSFFVSSFTNLTKEEIEMYVPAKFLAAGKQEPPAMDTTDNNRRHVL
jgi:hypothetical protein